MRTLPESASLDHLRRQAKELLAILRRREPKATLGEAQAALAREYGFTTWSDLKAEVSRRRAAPPTIAPDDLVSALVHRFALGRAIAPMRHVEDEWAGHVWELETTTGPVLLTQLMDYVEPEHIEVAAGLVDAAVAAGVAAPVPVRTPEGRVVVTVDGEHWRAHHRIPLGPMPTMPPAPELAAAAGTALGTLHALALAPPGPVVPWLTYRRSEDDWEQLVDRARRAGMPWAEALATAVPGFVALDAVRDDRDPADRAIFSNCDLQPGATRVAGRDQLVITGWDHAGAIPPDWEMANSLMSWSETIDGPGILDPAPGRSFLAAYHRRVELPERLELRMFTAGVSAWLNWTATRVMIVLDGDRDDEQLEKARRNVPRLLVEPLSLDRLERFAAALVV
jgi:Ser/Thr protein kinase RdoA (MazF antagonist)